MANEQDTTNTTENEIQLDNQDADSQVNNDIDKDVVDEQITTSEAKEESEIKEDSIDKEITSEDKELAPREEKLIVDDYNKIIETKDADLKSKENDFLKLYEKYTDKMVNPPISKKYNEVSKQVEDSINDAAIITALQDGIKTGNFKQFVKFLSPEDAYAFNNDIVQMTGEYHKLVNDYKDKEKGYADEYGKLQEKDFGTKIDEFITTNAKDVQEKHLLTKLKEKYGNTNEETLNDVLSLFREARVLGLNEEILKKQTDDLKNEMINSAVVNSGKVINKKAEITKESIRKMTPAQMDEVWKSL